MSDRVDEPKFDNTAESYVDRFLKPSQRAQPPQDTAALREQRIKVREERKARQKAALREYGARGHPPR